MSSRRTMELNVAWEAASNAFAANAVADWASDDNCQKSASKAILMRNKVTNVQKFNSNKRQFVFYRVKMQCFKWIFHRSHATEQLNVITLIVVKFDAQIISSFKRGITLLLIKVLSKWIAFDYFLITKLNSHKQNGTKWDSIKMCRRK